MFFSQCELTAGGQWWSGIPLCIQRAPTRQHTNPHTHTHTQCCGAVAAGIAQSERQTKEKTRPRLSLTNSLFQIFDIRFCDLTCKFSSYKTYSLYIQNIDHYCMGLGHTCRPNEMCGPQIFDVCYSLKTMKRVWNICVLPVGLRIWLKAFHLVVPSPTPVLLSFHLFQRSFLCDLPWLSPHPTSFSLSLW